MYAQRSQRERVIGQHSPRAESGDKCVFDNDCFSGRCSLLAGFGEEGLKICIDTLPNGTPCFFDNTCFSRRCSDLNPQDEHVCMDKAAPGEPCEHNDDCASDDCDDKFLATDICR